MTSTTVIALVLALTIGPSVAMARSMVRPLGLLRQAASDVIHLLAELLENAAAFSPPETVVTVPGHPAAAGHVLEIEDRGIGIQPGDLEEINRGPGAEPGRRRLAVAADGPVRGRPAGRQVRHQGAAAAVVLRWGDGHGPALRRGPVGGRDLGPSGHPGGRDPGPGRRHGRRRPGPHPPPEVAGDRPDLALLERVLEGLRSI